MRSLSLADFAAVLGKAFQVAVNGATVPLVLADARPSLVPHMPGSERQPFVLTFHATSPVVLPQQIYPFRHPTLGMMDIFIVPVGIKDGGILYEAVFS